MDYEKNFQDDDLKIRFLNIDENPVDHDSKITPYIDYYNSYYQLIYINSKNINVTINKTVRYYNEPILIVAKPFLNFSWHCLRKPFFYIDIKIHPKVLNNIPDSEKVLQFFYEFQDEERIIKLNNPRFSSLISFLDIIQTALFARCGRFSMESRVKTLISELNLIYETNYKEYVTSTDSVPVKIVDYVEKHYLDKITLEQLCNKFFVSDKTANSIFKLYTNKTFRQYVTELRMKTAKKLLESGYIEAKRCAELSGFTNYSTFFQAYKKFYGTAPSDILKKPEKYWPLKK